MASPPPPPPKASAFSPTPSHYDRPPPPLPSISSQTQQPSSASTPQQPPSNPPAAPPQALIDEHWIPELLKDKSKPDLEAVLHSPELLAALVHTRTPPHPQLSASEQPVSAHLQASIGLAQELLAVEGQIQAVRGRLAPSLVRASALERQFRAKQEEMDHALSPWAPKAVHTRLGLGIQEQDAQCRAMEESFLEGAGAGDGRASDREVAEWLRKYRESRKVLELRREKRCRLEEGRVGGWR